MGTLIPPHGTPLIQGMSLFVRSMNTQGFGLTRKASVVRRAEDLLGVALRKATIVAVYSYYTGWIVQTTDRVLWLRDHEHDPNDEEDNIIFVGANRAFDVLGADSHRPPLSVSAGMWFGAAIDQVGHIWVAGINDNNQLLVQSSVSDFFPPGRPSVKIDTGRVKILKVSCGTTHTMAITQDRDVLFSGSNDFGERVIGAETPIQRAVDIWAGHHRSYIKQENGLIRCFGKNDRMQLGADGSSSFLPTPRDSHVGREIVSIEATADLFTFFITNRGSLLVCGEATQNGASGAGTGGDVIPRMSRVRNMRNIVKVSTKSFFSIALNDAGQIFGTGQITGAYTVTHPALFYQLSAGAPPGTFKRSYVKRNSSDTERVVDIATCFNSSLALMEGGALIESGLNRMASEETDFPRQPNVNRSYPPTKLQTIWVREEQEEEQENEQ